MSEDLQSPNFGNVQNSGIVMVSLIILLMENKKREPSKMVPVFQL